MNLKRFTARTSREALALSGPQTRVVDAGGATLVPGLQDAHGHFTNLGASLQVLQLRGTTSYDQIVDMVRARAATAPIERRRLSVMPTTTRTRRTGPASPCATSRWGGGTSTWRPA